MRLVAILGILGLGTAPVAANAAYAGIRIGNTYYEIEVCVIIGEGEYCNVTPL
jgi:hypothetical protein